MMTGQSESDLKADMETKDSDLLHRLIQYVLSVLHQLLHLPEHFIQADRTRLHRVHRDGPEQTQGPEPRQQEESRHLPPPPEVSSC